MEDKTPLTAEWKLIPHSSQIADTGDYTGYYEITNGKASFESDLDDDEDLQHLIDFLNKNDYQLSTWRGKEEADFAWSQVKQLHEQTASLQERVKQLQSDKEQLHKVIVGHEETIIERVERIIELYQLNEKLMVELKERFMAEKEGGQQPDESDWQSFLKEHGLTEQPHT